ncbi:MAG: hypothetical protein WC592_07850 [Candidatus Omnitrophota bacterium]|nr:hypothetical protein [Candidatus Omnitrophota bacterium]
MLIRSVNYKLISVIWVFIWLLFSVRGYILTDSKVFKNSLGKSVEQKKRNLMKSGLYDFVLFCQKNIPEKENFVFVYDAKALDPVEGSRVSYYLYPRKMIKDAPYIMVFDMSGYKKEGFKLHASLSKNSFILRKAD